MKYDAARGHADIMRLCVRASERTRHFWFHSSCTRGMRHAEIVCARTLTRQRARARVQKKNRASASTGCSNACIMRILSNMQARVRACVRGCDLKRSNGKYAEAGQCRESARNIFPHNNGDWRHAARGKVGCRVCGSFAPLSQHSRLLFFLQTPPRLYRSKNCEHHSSAAKSERMSADSIR